MPTFTYTGVAEGGQRVSGVVDAYDEIEAMEQARSQVLYVESVKQVRSKNGILNMQITKHKIKPKELAILCSQFAINIKAGMSIIRTTQLVASQATDKYLRQTLGEVAKDVASGHSLADSFENKAPDLPRVFIETVRAGEESGNLAEGFDRLSKYYDRRAKVSSKIFGAMIYPVFVVVVAVAVVAVMMVMVIPAMAGMFEDLGSEMPIMTQILIGASTWVSQNILIILLILVVLVVALGAYGRTESGKETYAKIALKFPLLGQINTYGGAAQFASTMSTLVSSGLSTSRAVTITSRVLDNYILAKETGRNVGYLEEGRSLGDCMRESKYFPPTLVEMVAVGEESGSLEETLEVMGEFYESETQRVTDHALSMMEPIMLVFLGVFAGFIVISLYLPMFSMYAQM